MILTKTINRRRVERLYYRISDDAADISKQLYTAADPTDRAGLLNRLANLEGQLAELHPHAFGADPNPDEDGRDLAESLASSATLLYALAATEDNNTVRLNVMIAGVGIVEALLWHDLAAERNHGKRAELIDQVAEHAAIRVGGQAAESLACLAATERELAAAVIEGRPPKAPRTFAVPRMVLVAVFLIVGALLALPYVLPHLK